MYNTWHNVNYICQDSNNKVQCKLGRTMFGTSHRSSAPRTPHERGSALLRFDWTYEGLMVMFDAASNEEIRHKQSFLGGFLECPFHKEAIMDALSQLTLRKASCQPHCLSHLTHSSRVIASAQPISLLSDCQPPVSFQATHRPATHRPIPQEVEVSTQRLRST